jgi:APA family basic amino acid/polyamine antiporter
MQKQTPRLERKLSPAMCVALVVGNMVGAGIFLLPVDLAPLGWNAVWGWLATIGGALCLVAVLNRLAREMGRGCGPYAYPAAAFGPGVGFVVAWSYWISIWVTNAVLAVAVIRNLSILWPGLNSPGAGAGLAIGLLWLMTLVNCRGVRIAGGVQLVTTLLKLLPLLAAILLGAWLLGSGSAPVPVAEDPLDLGQLNTAATLALFAMLGFESAMVAGDRVERPERTIPRATLIGTAIAGLIYLLASSSVTLLLPGDAVAASNSPFATFFTTYMSSAAGSLVAAFAAIAALGAINGYVLLQGEMPFALAKEGLFPRWFGSLNRYEVPYRAQMLSTALATLLVLGNYSRGLAGLFTFMVLVTTSINIVFYAVSVAAAVKLEREGRFAGSSAFFALAALGLAFSLWAFYGAGIEASLWSLGMTAAGIPFYLLVRASKARAAEP